LGELSETACFREIRSFLWNVTRERSVTVAQVLAALSQMAELSLLRHDLVGKRLVRCVELGEERSGHLDEPRSGGGEGPFGRGDKYKIAHCILVGEWNQCHLVAVGAARNDCDAQSGGNEAEYGTDLLPFKGDARTYAPVAKQCIRGAAQA
jgi:hypothetical protein